MSPRRTTSLIAAGVASVAIGLLAGCGSSGIPDLTLASQPPVGTTVDTGAAGDSIGDILVFNATVTKDGKPFGRLYGTKLLVALPGQDGALKGIGLHQNQLTFVLSDGTIQVGGVQDYPVGGAKGKKVPPATRPITGGTGAYAGASGVLTTTELDAGGDRQQQFDFTD